MALVRFNTVVLNMKEVINPTILDGSEWAFEAGLDQYDLEGLDLNLVKFMKEAEVDVACLQEVGDFHSLPPGSGYKMMANPSHNRLGTAVIFKDTHRSRDEESTGSSIIHK